MEKPYPEIHGSSKDGSQLQVGGEGVSKVSWEVSKIQILPLPTRAKHERREGLARPSQ